MYETQMPSPVVVFVCLSRSDNLCGREKCRAKRCSEHKKELRERNDDDSMESAGSYAVAEATSPSEKHSRFWEESDPCRTRKRTTTSPNLVARGSRPHSHHSHFVSWLTTARDISRAITCHLNILHKLLWSNFLLAFQGFPEAARLTAPPYRWCLAVASL